MSFDFLSFLLGIGVGIGISYLVVWLLGRAIYRRLEAALEEKQEETEAKRINMKVERHGDLLYAFREDTDGFVCQGADLKDLKKQFTKRFPGQVGAIVGNTDELHQELVKQLKDAQNESSTGVGSTS